MIQSWATVVGASAAGLYAAERLARAGREVVVIDRQPKLDPTPRTLIVTRRLRDVLGPLADAAVVNEINRFELYTDGRSAEVSLEQPDLVIERSILIKTLAGAAKTAGATLQFGRRFRGLCPAEGGLSVMVEEGGSQTTTEIRSKVVLGADGVGSGVARAAGWPRLPTALIVQAIVPLPHSVPFDTVRVWFRPRDTPYFFWLIPESSEQAAVGLIGSRSSATRRILDDFLSEQGWQPMSYQAALTPIYDRWTPVRRRIGGGEVCLVGDAAGHVKVSTVGGVVTGLRGAAAVSDMLLTGRRRATYAALRTELGAHLVIRRALARFTQEHYSRLVDLLGERSGRVLAAHTRDEASTVLRRLLLAEPRLLPMALGGLLRRDSRRSSTPRAVSAADVRVDSGSGA